MKSNDKSSVGDVVYVSSVRERAARDAPAVERVLTPGEVKEIYDSTSAARKFLKCAGTRRDRWEKALVGRLLKAYARDSVVLDMPCGAGRMIPFLQSFGFNVIAADSSPFMIQAAQDRVSEEGCPAGEVKFHVADVFETRLPDDTCDIVLCNRLFHHFAESKDRRRALNELRRITRKTIILSFFCLSTWSGMVFYVKRFIRGKRITGNIPITLATMLSDAEDAGLRVKTFKPLIPLISKQCYLVLEK